MVALGGGARPGALLGARYPCTSGRCTCRWVQEWGRAAIMLYDSLKLAGPFAPSRGRVLGVLSPPSPPELWGERGQITRALNKQGYLAPKKTPPPRTVQ